MMPVDVTSDAVRLAGVLEHLEGRLQFRHDGRVDVPATNGACVLSGQSLSAFRAAASCDLSYRIEDLSDSSTPCRVAVCILAGGLNTRGHGAFGPLRRLGHETLLDHHLRRLHTSPLKDAPLLTFCSPLNAHEVASALGARGHVYAGGLAPRFSQMQPRVGPLVPAPGGEWNPTGHFDALRWLVISGALERVWDEDVLLVHSLTNFGHLYHRAQSVAQFVLDTGALAVVEVTPRRLDKHTGSLVVLGEAQDPHLVKYNYGLETPRPSGADHQVMSTNSWWLAVHALKRRLYAACSNLRDIVRAAAQGRHRDEATALVDLCLPVNPVLNEKKVENEVVLQAERDLDQLTLLPVVVHALLVGPERAISIKREADLAGGALILEKHVDPCQTCG